jgi:hypothetical protein
LKASVPSTAYCIITPEADGGTDTMVCRILLKAVGRSTAASLNELGDLPDSGGVEEFGPAPGVTLADTERNVRETIFADLIRRRAMLAARNSAGPHAFAFYVRTA